MIIRTIEDVDRVADMMDERLMAAADAHYERYEEHEDVDAVAERGVADDHAVRLAEDAA